MKHISKIMYILLGVLCATVVGGFSIAALGEAGSDTDPIVTKSYVEKRISELEAKIANNSSNNVDQKLASLQTQLEALALSSGNPAEGFTLVQVKAGSKLVLSESTMLILRAGSAKTIVGPGGGLADLTIGTDLVEGQSIIGNHLILAPKNDGRGVKVTGDSWMMIKGAYTIQ